MRSTLRLAATAAMLAVIPVSAHAQIIDTRNVDSYVYGGGGIFGQSFTTPGFTTLNSFSFWVGANDPRNGGVGAYDFYAQLFGWNGSTITGGPLYTSGVFSSGCCDDNVPPRYDFNVGAIAVTPGTQYLALIARTTQGGLKLGYVDGPGGFIDSYPGGEFIGGFGGGGAPNTSTASYSPIQFVPGNDLMFVANFAGPVTAAPEPATLFLLASGLGALGLIRRRAQR